MFEPFVKDGAINVVLLSYISLLDFLKADNKKLIKKINFVSEGF